MVIAIASGLIDASTAGILSACPATVLPAGIAPPTVKNLIVTLLTSSRPSMLSLTPTFRSVPRSRRSAPGAWHMNTQADQAPVPPPNGLLHDRKSGGYGQRVSVRVEIGGVQ